LFPSYGGEKQIEDSADERGSVFSKAYSLAEGKGIMGGTATGKKPRKNRFSVLFEGGDIIAVDRGEDRGKT